MEKAYSDIGKILGKYPEITSDEDAVLKEWLATDKNRQIFEELTSQESVIQMLKRAEEIKNTQGEKWQRLLEAINQAGEEGLTRKKVYWLRQWRIYVAAASLLIALSLIGYKWFGGKEKLPEATTPEMVKVNDVQPGQFKAKLTLADGSTLTILDSMNTDSLTRQGAVKLANKNGQLVYEAGKKPGGSASLVINTLTTAKAETYQLLLSDGSKVWLNSGSSITFPVHFIGKERRVEVTGEAFFQVAHNEQQPFIVKVNKTEIQVLGTSFNINSYADEAAVKTTLLTGKVRIVNQVSGRERTALLMPGQQAQVENEHIKIVSQVDVDQVVAWRNGLFYFNRDDIRTVMRQIARWYDVEVRYEGDIPNKEFWGKISRDLTAAEMLKILEKYGVHFKIQGKKIIVTP